MKQQKLYAQGYHDKAHKVTQPIRQLPINPRGGFAIVVVLSSLLILTTLFAIASQRSMAHLQTQSAEQRLAQRQADNVAILTILRDMGPDAIRSGNLTLPPPYNDKILRIQDVGGLIDLNDALSPLLPRLYQALDFPTDAERKLITWRQTGRQLSRIDDVIRITGADPSTLDALTQISTVHSGRTGIAAEFAPEDVLRIAGSPLSEALQTPPSNTNFAIYDDTGLIGTISIQGDQNLSRILEIR